MIYCGALLCCCAAMADAQVMKETHLKPDKAYDFYLKGDRICKKCHWRILGDGTVELKNKEGITGIYRPSEFIGVDNHPIARRILRHAVHGVGIPGRVIVPTAFDDEQYIDHP